MNFAEAEVRRGLEAGEFYPVFQPLVELRTGQLAGFEVLARWKPSGSDVIMPADFIPSVEKAGAIDRLTKEVLGKAFCCAPLSGCSLMLAVNLSARQLLDPGLPGLLKTAVEAGGFPLDRLTVEITESALVDDIRRATEVAQALKALHCRLALDDFGTGYSSLTHLRALPFDELKVDKSFVSSMTQHRESREIVASVVALGQGLGLLTVAEGVETREQAEMLFWMGCDLAQGWYYGKPVAAGEVGRVIARSPWENLSDASPEDGDPLASLHAQPTHRLSQLQAIYDGAPVGLAFLDRELRYRSLNRQLAEMNGAPAAAHLGRTVSEVIPQVYRQVEPYLRRALAGEPATGVEIRKPATESHPEGQALMCSYRTVREGGGEVVGVSVAVMDVTQRVRAEEALRETEDHYRHMMSLGPHVPWVLDAKGEVTDASPRWEEYTGQPLEEGLGNGWQRMLHPEDLKPTQEAIRHSLESGLPIDVEYRVRRPDGSWSWMRSRGAPRFSESGAIVCIYGVVEEIDGNKQRSAELDACEAELQAAIECVPVGIVLADGGDGTIYTVNPAARAVLGSGAFPGQKMSEYPRMGILGEDGAPIAAEKHPLARAIQRSEKTELRPYLIRRADGTEIRALVSGRAILSDEGRLIGGMMMIGSWTPVEAAPVAADQSAA